MTDQLATRPHALYRAYDHDDALLYVGITVNPGSRFPDHADGSGWWEHVARITLERHPNRPSVLAAERAAIYAEAPRWNVQHTSIGRRETSSPVADHQVDAAEVEHGWAYADVVGSHAGKFLRRLWEDRERHEYIIDKLDEALASMPEADLIDAMWAAEELAKAEESGFPYCWPHGGHFFHDACLGAWLLLHKRGYHVPEPHAYCCGFRTRSCHRRWVTLSA